MNLQPYVTEKSLGQAKRGIFTFVGREGANKLTVAASLKKLHKVDPQNITVINVKPSGRVFRQAKGMTKGFKKILVTLPKGQKIPGFEIVEDKKETKHAAKA